MHDDAATERTAASDRREEQICGRPVACTETGDGASTTETRTGEEWRGRAEGDGGREAASGFSPS
ncbi:phosphomannomutase [Sesbania bispinosa]|nr:phosphomannomutase [Sesbania bispinosa]